jgi:hypothetical protein
MARTVNRNQTLEEFRSNYNGLAADVGTLSGLSGNISNQGNIVDAINELEAKTFYFDSFTFTATGSQTTFNSSHESDSKTVRIRTGRYQVFKNSALLIEGNDFNLGSLSNGEYGAITLNSGASAGDIITIYTFTGSVVGTQSGVGGAGGGQFTETAQNTIYNINSNGVILNGDSTSRTTVLESGYTLQLAGKTFAEDDLISGVAGKKVQFPIVSDGTAQFTGGVGTGFSSITSTALVGNLTGDVTGNVTGDVSGSSGTTNSISAHSINALSDVALDSPANGQVLVYNTSSSKFENQNAAATYTNEDAQDTVAAMIAAGTHSNITVTYDDAANTMSFSAASQYSDTNARNAVSGGDGLAYNASSGVFAVNTSNGIEINSDSVELDYEIVSSAPSGVGSTATGHLWFVV